MSMQELMRMKKHVDDMKIKHAQSITRLQNVESEFVRELTALQKAHDWATISYKNTVELTTDTTEKEYLAWESTLRQAMIKTKEVLAQAIEKAETEKETAMTKMRAILQKEGYDV